MKNIYKIVRKAEMWPPKTIEMKDIIIVGFSVPEAFSCDGPPRISIIHNTFFFYLPEKYRLCQEKNKVQKKN